MTRAARLVLFATFAITGFSALTLQVVWQRVISVHAGVDLVSFTTVVSAFLAGLGLGSLLGGHLADRLGPRRSLLAFAGSNTAIGLFAWVSVWLFYDVYARVATDLASTGAKFAFNFALLLVPTTLMGLSLPLVAKGLVERVQDAGALVGRLYAVNTLGAASGAAVSGWLLLGNLGFNGAVRVAGSLNLLAAVLALSLWRVARRADAATTEGAEVPAGVSAPAGTGPTLGGGSRTGPAAAGRAGPWFALYALTGAVALGFELVFFRLIDSIMRSNSYSFAHVLAVYLTCFGIGAAIGGKLLEQARDAARWFLGLQFAVGVAALAGVVVLVQVAPRLGLRDVLRGYFGGDGFNTGFSEIDTLAEGVKLVFAYGAAPLLVMAVPVLLMGASFPFVQTLVSERVETLGRRTGSLLAANIAGNVFGVLLVGFVLIDRLGTAGTMLVLAGVQLVPGVACALRFAEPRRRATLAVGAVGLVVVLAVAFPSNRGLWAFIHGVPDDASFELAEDRSCVTAIKKGVFGPEGLNGFLYINASGQNGYPWDDFHVLVGLTAALAHPEPRRAMAVGLGMGGTPYALAADERVLTVDAVELCGGQVDLLQGLAEDGSDEHRRLLAEERLRLRIDDGREFLLSADEGFDSVTVDVLRPQSAFSGSLYSVEFYELVRDRLEGDGIMVQWAATPRVLNSVSQVFPHVIGLAVPSYGNSQFLLASKQPIDYDRAEMLRRLEDHVGPDVFTSGQRRAVEEFYASAQPVCYVGGQPVDSAGEALNRDVFPRDEYFLNNTFAVPAPQRCG
ncbi:MAG: fused MFS/spermidine synthase [Acidimicrobiia bacterium]